MALQEPTEIAILLLAVGVLLAVSALFSRAASRAGIPGFLIFLGVGMLAGSEGVGGIPFEDCLSFRLGTVALALILFEERFRGSGSSFENFGGIWRLNLDKVLSTSYPAGDE